MQNAQTTDRNEYTRQLFERLPTLSRIEGHLTMAPGVIRELVREAYDSGYRDGAARLAAEAKKAPEKDRYDVLKEIFDQ